MRRALLVVALLADGSFNVNGVWSPSKSQPIARVAAAPAPACTSRQRYSWRPERPKAGSFVELRVTDVADGEQLQATVAGERLHFQLRSGDTLVALAPIPIDSSNGVTLRVSCSGAPSDTVPIRIRVSPSRYPVERLTVDPRFSAAPDSATVERMRQEGNRAAAVSREAHHTPRLWTRPFVAPRPSRITSGYGRGREFNGAITSRHMGTDFAGQVGAPVYAANRGVVRLVDEFYLGGNVVYLDHGAGLITAYLHLSQALVAVDDTVERGVLLGRVGATGRVTASHLHLIARYGSISLDAMSLLAVTQPRTVTRRPAVKIPTPPKA